MGIFHLVGYLLLLQCLPLVARYELRGAQVADRNHVVVTAQACLLVLFWVFFGGYAIDSWRYTTGFWSPYFNYNEEQVFWVTGNILSRVVVAPWAVKLMAAIGTFVLCIAVIRFHNRDNRILAVVALFLIPLLPGFFLTYGNVLRQGLGATVAIVGILCFLNRSYWLFLVCLVVGFFLHQTSVIVVGAFLTAVYVGKLAPYALIALPWSSFAAYHFLQLLGIELGDYILYAYYAEGDFHYLKFAVGYSLAWIIWFVSKRWEGPERHLAITYVYLVAFSSMLLRYEVPFERTLLYGDFLLIFVAPVMLKNAILEYRNMRGIAWFVAMIGGAFLWTHHSIGGTLGFT